MENITIIRDAAALNKAITLAISTGKRYRAQLHTVTVSALLMAVTDGQPDPLNRIFASLTSNDANALRFYIKRIHVFVGYGGYLPPKGADVSEIEEKGSMGAVLGFEKKRFFVLNNSSAPQIAKNKEMVAQMCGTILIAGQKPWLPFFVPNNFQSSRTFGDAEALDALLKVQKTIEDGSTDRVTVTVSDRVKQIIAKALAGLEATREQVDLGYDLDLQAEDVPLSKPATRQRRSPKAPLAIAAPAAG